MGPGRVPFTADLNLTGNPSPNQGVMGAGHNPLRRADAGRRVPLPEDAPSSSGGTRRLQAAARRFPEAATVPGVLSRY